LLSREIPSLSFGDPIQFFLRLTRVLHNRSTFLTYYAISPTQKTSIFWDATTGTYAAGCSVRPTTILHCSNRMNAGLRPVGPNPFVEIGAINNSRREGVPDGILR
jgi:hypothetical protein